MTLANKILIVIFNTVLFVVSFRKAAGSLSLKRLNMYSVAFYYLLFFCFIGSSLAFLGFRNHYILQKIQDEEVFTKGYFITMYAVIALPLFLTFISRLMGIGNYTDFYREYQKQPINLNSTSEETTYTITVLLTGLGALALAYTFVSYGAVPILQALMGGGYNATARIAISRGFPGNEYIKNILALSLIPALSYLAYIYFRITRHRRWKILFLILLALSFFSKTYALEKAPLVIYLSYFYLIDCMMGTVKDLKNIIRLLILGVVIILFAYSLMNYDGTLLSITNGPLSRLLITQIATLFLHVQVFPGMRGFLYGTSFATILGGSNIRSGRVVMEVFYPAEVAHGTAGVMNSLYIGEAYANFGWMGVLLGPLAVGLVLALVLTFILKQDKDPLNMAIYIIFASVYTSALVGGFVDFFCNANLIVMIFIFIMIKLASNSGKLILRNNIRMN